LVLVLEAGPGLLFAFDAVSSFKLACVRKYALDTPKSGFAAAFEGPLERRG
jgi:hypothetical protein